VRQIEALVKDEGAAKAKRDKPRKDADTKAAELELAEVLGLGVEIKRKGRGEKGELRIHYTSLDQLEDLRYRLLRKPGR
jgi:ParB family chromosome partitioning protein